MNPQIQVTITGNSADLQAAVDKASGSLESLGEVADTTAGQVDAAGAASATAVPEIEATGASAEAASGGFDLLGGSMLTALAPLAALFLGFKGIQDIISSGKAQIDQWNNAQAQLANTLNNGNGVIGITVEQIDALANSTSKNTAITSANTLAADAQLANAKLSAPVYAMAAKSIDDIGTAMANAKGQAVPSSQQMAQAAKLLGTALQDPTTGVNALKRAGIELTAQQQDQVKALQATGDTLGAQTLLMQDFATATNDKAVTATKTFAGQTAVLKKNLDDLSGSIVSGIEKAISDLGHAFLADLPFMEKLGGYIRDFLQPFFKALTDVIEKDLIPTIEKHKAGLADLLKGMTILLAIALSPLIIGFALWMASVIAITAVISWLINVISDLINWFKHAYDDIKQWVTDVVNWFSALGADIAKAISGIEAIIEAPFTAAFKTIKSGIADVVSTFDRAKNDLTAAPGHAVSGISGLLDKIPGFANGVTNFSGGLAMVGENGPELVNLPNGSSVTPNSKISNSSSVTIGTIVLSSAEAVNTFFNQIDRDNILVSKGLSPARGLS